MKGGDATLNPIDEMSYTLKDSVTSFQNTLKGDFKNKNKNMLIYNKMAKYFDKYVKDFKNLCSPAFIYLFISVIAFIILAIQNFGNTTKFCLGG